MFDMLVASLYHTANIDRTCENVDEAVPRLYCFCLKGAFGHGKTKNNVEE